MSKRPLFPKTSLESEELKDYRNAMRYYRLTRSLWDLQISGVDPDEKRKEIQESYVRLNVAERSSLSGRDEFPWSLEITNKI